VGRSANAPLTPVSKGLNLAFKAIMPDVDEQWNMAVDDIPGLTQKA